MSSHNSFETPAVARLDPWCQVPGCSRIARYAYHVLHGCADDCGAENFVRLCKAHLDGLRRGFVRVRGRAPDQLRWELGRRPDGTPFMVVEPPSR